MPFPIHAFLLSCMHALPWEVHAVRDIVRITPDGIVIYNERCEMLFYYARNKERTLLRTLRDTNITADQKKFKISFCISLGRIGHADWGIAFAVSFAILNFIIKLLSNAYHIKILLTEFFIPALSWLYDASQSIEIPPSPIENRARSSPLVCAARLLSLPPSFRIYLSLSLSHTHTLSLSLSHEMAL